MTPAPVPHPQGLPQPPPAQPHPQPTPPTQQLHPEIRSVVQLNHAHAHKVYFSGPLIRKLEYNPDGQKPIKDEGWIEIWAQLGGTTLSIWDMKEIEAASKQGKEVPPSYINVTDAYVQILGSVTVPATPTTSSRRYPNVLTVNTAGANLYLFSCQSIPTLTSWAAALRLTSWEKSRLDEIYTAHLIRITLTARDVPTTLVKGKMEGWARVRIAGQTDWKKVWLVIQEGSGDHSNDQHPAVTKGSVASPPTAIKKKRVSNIFSSSSPSFPSSPTFPSKPLISMYASPKPKDKKKAPLLTISNLSQAFAVFPERPELISKSTLMKIEGLLDESEIAGNWKGREGWVFIMPEGETGTEKLPQSGVAGQGGGQVAEMLKWIVALHDAFKLYGRPEAWTWDPRDPISLMYGYPVGPLKESLFLDREIAEAMDPREDRTSFYRAELKKFLQQHMRLPVQVVNPQNRGQPPGAGFDGTNPNNPTDSGNGALPPLPLTSDVGGPQLPPLSFGSGGTVPFPANAPNNAVTPNANNNNVPSSRLSTIEESSVVTHNGTQYQQNPTGQNLRGNIRPGVATPGGGFTSSPPSIPENSSYGDAGPAVPAKLPPSSPMSGASPQQQQYPSGFSQSPPQPGSTTNVLPPRFQNQNQGQGGLGGYTPRSTTSAPTGPGFANSSQSSLVGSRAAASSPVPNFPGDQQPGATTRPPMGPLGSSGSPPQSFGASFQSPNNANGTTVAPRPLLQTSTSAGTTTTTSSTTMSAATSTSGGLDTEDSNDLLKEPGVMYILGGGGPQSSQAKKPGFMPGYGAGVGAGMGAGFGSGVGPGVGAGVGAGLGAGVGAGLGSMPHLGVGPTVGGSGPVFGGAYNENYDEDEDDAYLYGSNGDGFDRDGETTSSRPDALAAPMPQAPGTLRAAYDGIADSEDSHLQLGQEQSGTGQQQYKYSGPPIRKDPPMSFVGTDSSPIPTTAPKSETTSPSNVAKSLGTVAPSPGGISDRPGPTRFGSGLGRKPSGARELVAPRHVLPPSHPSGTASVSNNIGVAGDNSPAITEEGSAMEATVELASKVKVGIATPRETGGLDDGGVGEEALAAWTYLNNFADGGEGVGGYESSAIDPATTTATPSTIQAPPPPPEMLSAAVEPLKTRHSNFQAGSSSGPGSLYNANETLPYTESSFAPSNKAAERKAKAQAQKDAQLAAVHRPGRANGKKKSMVGAWDSSDEEEEEEEEEEDEDVDSDGERRIDSGYKGKGAQQHPQNGPSGSGPSSSLGHGRIGSLMQGGPGGDPSEVVTPSQLRPPRNLPQIPGRPGPGDENTFSRRIPSDQYTDAARRTYYEEGPQIRTQAEAPMPGAQRQTIWTKVLDPGQQAVRQQSENAKETFVQLEPSETMTKAFALHGLLSVGIQDKEDRSAKRQEELARESGASLINVPNKPPPPQSGLLGYVTAHERERKREGGLGAALTEREREKRVAEERQRRLDEQQRQQLDQMQQGMAFNPMMNPMMMNMMMNPMMTGGGMNPMMTGGGMGGMNPMMSGGGMGMNPMLSGMMGGGGFNPQHMFAAQQAAQAYQQAIMAFSVAGSQVGGPTAAGGGGGGGNGAEGGATPSQGGNNTGLNPGMSPGMGGISPAMTGNMGGFDPRMSMFGMMGMGGMGMPMGMPMGMGGLGPQMTGMSNFDAMASPGQGYAGGGGGGMGVGLGMNASPNVNEFGVGGGGMGMGSLGLQPPVMQRSQFSSRTSSPAARGSPKVPGPNGEYQQQQERGRPSRPASPK